MIDLQIPKRTEGRHNSDIGNDQLYKYYRKNMPRVESIAGGITSGSYDIKAKEYSDILKDINTGIIDIIILENFEYILPFRLGTISMKQKEVKPRLDENGDLDTRNLSIDYKATKELWKSDPEAFKNRDKIFHTNEHTNGNRMSFWWSKRKAFVQGIRAYYFKACRDMSRRPAQIFKSSETKLTFFETPGKNKFYK